MDSTRTGRMADWWIDDASGRGRASPDDPAVQRLVAEIDPHARVTDLGGTMSLNLRIDPAGLVLRVHQPFVSRRRLLGVQAVRFALTRCGLIAPPPVSQGGRTVFPCSLPSGRRWAELEMYIPHERPAPTMDSYRWMFGVMGRLHRALAALDLTGPRPLVATYAPPGSLRRWMQVTEAAVQHDVESRDAVQRMRSLLGRLRRRWIPAARLPQHLVHGDMRLGNVCRSPQGETVYLDFGFLATRPRVHELAYALAFMARALDGHDEPGRFGWGSVQGLIEKYEREAASSLTALEREALPMYTAAVPLYFCAIAGFSPDPVGQLRASLPFLPLSEWLLAHLEAPLGTTAEETWSAMRVKPVTGSHQP